MTSSASPPRRDACTAPAATAPQQISVHRTGARQDGSPSTQAKRRHPWHPANSTKRDPNSSPSPQRTVTPGLLVSQRVMALGSVYLRACFILVRSGGGAHGSAGGEGLRRRQDGLRSPAFELGGVGHAHVGRARCQRVCWLLLVPIREPVDGRGGTRSDVTHSITARALSWRVRDLERRRVWQARKVQRKMLSGICDNTSRVRRVVLNRSCTRRGRSRRPRKDSRVAPRPIAVPASCLLPQRVAVVEVWEAVFLSVAAAANCIIEPRWVVALRCQRWWNHWHFRFLSLQGCETLVPL